MRVPHIPLAGEDPSDAVTGLHDPALRAAARRFEAETGERLADLLPVPWDEATLGVYLIVRGYPPSDEPEAIPAEPAKPGPPSPPEGPFKAASKPVKAG